MDHDPGYLPPHGYNEIDAGTNRYDKHLMWHTQLFLVVN
jgi:hypothetical protein